MFIEQLPEMSMRIMFKSLIVLGACFSLAACAESPSKSPTEKQQESTATHNWSDMSYTDWNRMLNFSDKCPAKFDGNTKRFLNIRVLNNSTSLLAISCELGAYQDGKLLYLLHTDKISPLSPTLPKFEIHWDLEKQTIVWGNRYVEGNFLVLENWYAGSGECGYRAFYSIADVITHSSPKPEKVFGDSNCEDGVYVDDWPQIDKFNQTGQD